MVFHSFQFFIFLLITYTVFRLFPRQYQWGVLLMGSLVFYGYYSWLATLILLGLSVIMFFIGQQLEAASPRNQAAVLWSGIVLNVGVLGYFKYTNFFLQNVAQLSGRNFEPLAIFLPVGISFYVFQAMAYLLDIYLGKIRAERHLGYFCLYLAFFPKLLQGPIERAADLIPQLKQEYQPDRPRDLQALQMILWGLFYKLSIADRIALLVDPVFANLGVYSGFPLFVIVNLYTLQIYFDFAGYTHIARGVGLLFGIRLSENFNHPYWATNIQDFWRRWHMTFSFWIRDYLFVPLVAAYRYRGSWGIAAAAVLTFLIAGIWHGASWGFVVFGLIHGIYMAVSIATLKTRNRWVKSLRLPAWLVTGYGMIILFEMITFSFIFFRAETLSDAGWIIRNIFSAALPASLWEVVSIWQAILLAVVFWAIGWKYALLAWEKAGKLQHGLIRWQIFNAFVLNCIIFLGVISGGAYLYFIF